MIDIKQKYKDNVKMPSNKKFGLTFSVLFLVLYIFFLYIKNNLAILFLIFSIILLMVSLMKPSLLTILNKLWFMFGILLQKIISPLILIFLYFFIFFPISLIMKIFQVDSLNLKKKKNKGSYWIEDNSKNNSYDFDRMF